MIIKKMIKIIEKMMSKICVEIVFFEKLVIINISQD